MFQLYSDRLRLFPLNEPQLILLLKSETALYRRLGLQIKRLEVVSAYSDFREELKESIRDYTLPAFKSNRENYIWFTHWLIVLEDQALCVGGIGGSGFPDEKGESMIGYFVDRRFEGRGIATEAVKTFVDWLFLLPNLNAVWADTPADHIASQRVLLKNGFAKADGDTEIIRWRKLRPCITAALAGAAR